MKKVLFILIGVIASGLLLYPTGCDNIEQVKGSADNIPQEPEFNFIFKYGVTARNTLDTFKGTFTKDMGLEAPITIGLVLSKDEMDSVQRKMTEIDFFSYPDKFSVILPAGENETRVLPYPTYFFKVTDGGRTKELLWHEKVTNSEARADKLRELIKLIRSIIERKAEYKALPEAKSGYL
jgi:hypothetical protein